MQHADSTPHALRRDIETAIVTGEFPPGARLEEIALAARFDVSRTPIREALQLLAADGLVERQPRRGAYVAAPGPERLYQMFEAMAELEASCGRFAARRASKAARLEIERRHLDCLAAIDDPDAYYALNELFHRAIYDAAGNAFLAEQAGALQRRLQPYRRLQLRIFGRTRQSFEEHGAIVAAILSGDDATVAAALRSHVALQGDRFSDLVASLSGARMAG